MRGYWRGFNSIGSDTNERGYGSNSTTAAAFGGAMSVSRDNSSYGTVRRYLLEIPGDTLLSTTDTCMRPAAVKSKGNCCRIQFPGGSRRFGSRKS
jgi:hypothetical protein